MSITKVLSENMIFWMINTSSNIFLSKIVNTVNYCRLIVCKAFDSDLIEKMKMKNNKLSLFIDILISLRNLEYFKMWEIISKVNEQFLIFIERKKFSLLRLKRTFSH